MSLWGNLDAANNAPKHGSTAGYGGNTPQVTGNTQVYYANTKIGAFAAGEALGVFGVDAQEQANTNTTSTTTGHPAHAGWVLRKVGTGPVVTITANAGAVAVNSYISFSKGDGAAGSGNTAANASITVNTAGYIQSITINSGGLYANTPLATPNTGNAVFTLTMGGRAGRIQAETLVAMGNGFSNHTDTIYN